MDRFFFFDWESTEIYSSLLQRMDPYQARDSAIRWASITFHLSGPPAQDSSPLIRSVTGAQASAPATGTARGQAGNPRTEPPVLRLLSPGGRTSPTPHPSGGPGAAPRRLPPTGQRRQSP